MWLNHTDRTKYRPGPTSGEPGNKKKRRESEKENETEK
jgi:hypothetical protein